MATETPLPTFDFKIPLEIKNSKNKIHILELWESAKNAWKNDDLKKIITDLNEIIKFDDTMYGVWYNLGIAKSFDIGCFDKAIELKLDHIDSWIAKSHCHSLATNMPYGDDNLDQYLHIENEMTCGDIVREIKIINKLKISELDDPSFWAMIFNQETFLIDSTLNVSLCLLKYSRWNDAVILLEKTIGLEIPRNIYLFFQGIAYRESKNFEKSLEMFDEIINGESNNIYALLQKGLTLFEKGEIKKGEKILHEIINLNENSNFFKYCSESSEEFPTRYFEDSLKMIKNGIDEKVILQIKSDTKKLYNYNDREKIGVTYNFGWHA